MSAKSSASEVMKVNRKENYKEIINSLRRDVINSRKYFSFNDNHKSRAMALDFMVEKYELDHLDVFTYLGSEEAQRLMLSHVPENGIGYVQVYIRQNGKSFNPYGVIFTPFNIIQKEWGLGYKDTKTDDFVFFECLYENDHTRFRGCFRK